jgi:hypothetical protein
VVDVGVQAALLENVLILRERLGLVQDRRYPFGRHDGELGGDGAGAAGWHGGEQHAADQFQLVPLQQAP